MGEVVSSCGPPKIDETRKAFEKDLRDMIKGRVEVFRAGSHLGARHIWRKGNG